MKENIIDIKEDIRIPGTDIILEAGDKIKIIESQSIPQNSIVRGEVRDTVSNMDYSKAKREYGIDPNDLVGWFANKYNRAFGWGIFKASDSDKREFGNDVFRSYSEKSNSTNIIKFNLSTGTYAFVDSEAYERDIIKFDSMSKYDRIVIEPTEKAFREFNII